MMKRFFAAFALLGLTALGGCNSTGKPTLESHVVTNPETRMGVSTNAVSGVGFLTAEAICVQPVPDSRNCIGGVVISRPGVFKPSLVAMIPIDCRLDPNCKIGAAIGGIGEPTFNVGLNAAAAIVGAAVGKPSITLNNGNSIDNSNEQWQDQIQLQDQRQRQRLHNTNVNIGGQDGCGTC